MGESEEREWSGGAVRREGCEMQFHPSIVPIFAHELAVFQAAFFRHVNHGTPFLLGESPSIIRGRRGNAPLIHTETHSAIVEDDAVIHRALVRLVLFQLLQMVHAGLQVALRLQLVL